MITPHCCSSVGFISDLRVRYLDVQSLEVGPALQLAAQPTAVRIPRRRRAVEHLVLVVLDGVQLFAVGDIDVAGGTHGLSAALADETRYVVLERGTHH